MKKENHCLCNTYLWAAKGINADMADPWVPGLPKYPWHDLLCQGSTEEYLPACGELWEAKEPPSNVVPPESTVWIDLLLLKNKNMQIGWPEERGSLPYCGRGIYHKVAGPFFVYFNFICMVQLCKEDYVTWSSVCIICMLRIGPSPLLGCRAVLQYWANSWCRREIKYRARHFQNCSNRIKLLYREIAEKKITENLFTPSYSWIDCSWFFGIIIGEFWGCKNTRPFSYKYVWPKNKQTKCVKTRSHEVHLFFHLS